MTHDAAHESTELNARHKPTPPAPTSDVSQEGAAGLPLQTLISPLGQAALSGRGNDPQRAATIQRMQQTYGNRAVQRYLAAGSGGATVAIQRHASWEHRLLGDAKPGDLAAIARGTDPKQRTHLLQQERDRLRLWQHDPEHVTEAQVKATWGDDIRTVVLKQSKLVVTYGELNTMGDYLPNPAAIDSSPKETILPILQLVRQQGFNRIIDLLGETRTITTPEGGGVTMPAYEHFAGAIGPDGGTGTVAGITETQDLNKVTAGSGENQYQSLLSRNACHFAPFSWDRWEEFHQQARTAALKAFQTKQDQKARDEAAHDAWIANGYADHFLQDSFAGGHLVNKTLMMQWFVEWVAQHNADSRWDRLWKGNRSMWNIDLEHWDQISQMTTAKQPNLAGRQHYQGKGPQGGSVDPQTAEEQSIPQARQAAAGVQGGPEQYKAYLAFLNSSAVQLASGAVHDYFNDKDHALTAGNPAGEQFVIYGDETMVSGGEGVRIAGETAHRSQQAIQQLIDSGAAADNVAEIRKHFPNQVKSQDSGAWLPLEQWNDSLRQLCFEKIFPNVHFRIIDTIGARMGKVSQDQK